MTKRAGPAGRLLRPLPFEVVRLTATLGGVAVALALVGLGRSGTGGNDEINSENATMLQEEVTGPSQRSGDAEAGLAYLLEGDFIGSGIPLDVYKRLVPASDSRGVAIPRSPDADLYGIDQNVFTMPTGVEVIAGVTCLGCHGSWFDGAFVIGLGDTARDWSGSSGRFPGAEIKAFAATMHPVGSAGWEALSQYVRGVEVVHGKARTPFRGVNPAFRIEEVAAAHRVPGSLAWSERRVYPVSERVIASDVPAWWHVKKKDKLYYNGGGRGDFAKLIQQIGVVAIGDAKDAERINERMVDLLAYLRTIEPPAFPRAIDLELAEAGRLVFSNNCAECHGTYGWGDDPSWTYPNKVVSVEVVGTDPLYAQAQMDSGLSRWLNASWFNRVEPRAWAEPALGYIAPPLDGIWVTAPYLHNGSVPTLEALLESSKRPVRWQRSFRDDDYDYERIGWRYRVVDGDAERDAAGAFGRDVYDTTVPGYGNGGHDFGDALSDEERRALLEYLKTL